MATVTIGRCSNNQSHTFSIKSSLLEWNKTARAKTRLTIRSLLQIAISPTEVRKISKQLQTLVNPLCFLSKILKIKNQETLISQAGRLSILQKLSDENAFEKKDREIEHLSELTSLSHNAKDYLRFSDPEGIGALVA
jgi:hypothetical protein